jgi:hypothetical protein
MCQRTGYTGHIKQNAFHCVSHPSSPQFFPVFDRLKQSATDHQLLTLHLVDLTSMEDKVITIVFGSLSATLALVSILFAYLQLRGLRPAIAPDEEQDVPLPIVAQEEPKPDPPAVVAVQEALVTNSPYAS